jgi:hypothetical protein
MAIVSKPATKAFREHWPLGPTKFERELAEERAREQNRPAGWECACGTWNECSRPSGAFDEVCWKCGALNPAPDHAACK